MQAHILSFYTPLCSGWGHKVISFHEWNIEHHASHYTHPRSLGWGQKVKTFFLNFITLMLHFKIKGIARRVSCKYLFCPYTHPRPMGPGQKVKTFFLNVVMLHIKLKGKKYRPTNKQKLWHYTHTWPLGWVKRSDIEIVYIYIYRSNFLLLN